MLRYASLRKQPKRLLALTGLARREFEELLPAFAHAYALRSPPERTRSGQKRQRAAGGGRRGHLAAVEDKLLFILVYQKTYPLQVVHGALFGMSQSSANDWIHRLLPVLRDALDTLGVLPERAGPQLAAHEQRQAEPPDLIIDGTERRRQRPKSREKRDSYYSGKKRVHSLKNVVVVNTRTRRVAFLSATYPGRAHDKTIADQAQVRYPPGCTLRQDSAFQGYRPPEPDAVQQAKKSRAEVN
jgi:hypothetical protein